MTSQRGRILEIAEAALDLEGAERAAFVAERCGADEPLLQAVERLLAHSAVDEEQALLGENRRLLDRLEKLVRDPRSTILDPSTLASPLEIGQEGGGRQRYTDIQEAGRGGMGIVRHVKDKRLGRQVALKRLRTDADEGGPGRSSHTTPRDLELFLREARVTAQLDHPGIVPIYELDADADGQPFFTMPFVRGRTLTDIIPLARGGKDGWNLPRALGVIQRVCETIAYAHSKGVVHRDIKPANILVGRFGEVYVMDWGVAHVMGRPDERSRSDDPRSTRIVPPKDEAGPLLTRKGNVVGTPAYMSPEQARGEMELVDELSDVYALGATLYNLLTGWAPYSHTRGRALSREVLASILEGPPPPVHELDQLAAPELEAICNRAMARQRSERFASAAELGGEIRDWIEGRVVHSYEEGAFAELRKWVRRNRSLSVALAAALLSLFLGLGSTVYVQAAAAKTESGLNENLRDTNVILDRVVGFLVGLFRASTPEEVRGAEGPTARELLDRGAEDVRENLEEDPRVRSQLMGAIGYAYASLGQYHDAEQLLSEARASAIELYGEEAPATIEPSLHLAAVLRMRERYQEAEALLVPTLALARRELPADDDDILEAMDMLGIVYERLGRLSEAEALHLESRATRERLYGPDDERTLRAIALLAAVYQQQRRHEEALALRERVLERSIASHTPDDPESLHAANNLGTTLFDLGRQPRARAVLEETLTRRMRVLGPTHADTCITAANLVKVLSALQRFEEAEALAFDTIGALEEEFPDGSATTIEMTKALARLYEHWNNREGSIRLYLEALEMAERVLPALDQKMVSLLFELGSVYRKSGDYEAAERYLSRAFEITDLAPGWGDIDGPNILEFLVVVLLNLGRNDEALTRAEELVNRTFPENSQLGYRQELLEQARAGASTGEKQQ